MMMQLDLAATFRAARKDDAGDIARLFLISSDGLAAYIWSRLAEPGQALENVGRARYARDGVAFSYENCAVVDIAGKVVAMAHAFAMQADDGGEPEPDPVLRPYAELEDPGSLYLSGLAVNDELRSRGLGGKLLARVERQARDRGLARVSLICFEANTGAMRLYANSGYREQDRRAIVAHPSLHYSDGDAVLLVKDVA